MLTGSAIAAAVFDKSIVIRPFDVSHLGTNSHDLTLGPYIKTYTNTIRDYRGGIRVLDPKKDNPTDIRIIPEEGFVLQPGELYLAHTNEVAGSNKFIPCIEGRSSLARLGIGVHVCAGFGDLGFIAQWTLEIVVVRPVLIYRDMRICQIYFYETLGNIDRLYSGKYKDSMGAVESRLHLDFEQKDG